METIRYSPIAREDVKLEPRNGTFEVTLADGSVVVLSALDVAHLLSDAYATASVPTNLVTGQIYRLTDGVRGLWAMSQGGNAFGLSHEWLNVKEFGAKGDNSTDDTTAIAAAITASASGVVYFPPGTYVITASLTPLSSTVLLGAGPRITTIKAQAGLQNATLVSLSAKSSVLIQGLGFQGAGKTNDTSGTNYRNGNGIYLSGCSNVTVRNCYFTNCHNGVMDEDSTGGILVIDNEFLISHLAQSCIKFRGTAESVIRGNYLGQTIAASSGAVQGIWVRNGVNTAAGISIVGNYVSDSMTAFTIASSAAIRAMSPG